MEYKEFFEQFKNAHQDWSSARIGTAEAAREITRLWHLVPMIEPAAKRSDAEYSLNDFEAEVSPQAQERMARAVQVIGEASSDAGTVAERIARAEQGLKDVTSIANESDNLNERHAILSMNEWLGTDLADLRRLAAHDSADSDGDRD